MYMLCSTNNLHKNTIYTLYTLKYATLTNLIHLGQIVIIKRALG